MGISFGSPLLDRQRGQVDLRPVTLLNLLTDWGGELAELAGRRVPSCSQATATEDGGRHRVRSVDSTHATSA